MLHVLPNWQKFDSFNSQEAYDDTQFFIKMHMTIIIPWKAMITYLPAVRQIHEKPNNSSRLYSSQDQ